MATSKLALTATRRAGDLLFISGQLPRLSDGTIVKGDIAAQTRQALKNLAACLADEGLQLDDVVKTTVWLTRAELAGDFNAAYAEVFAKPYPARSTVISGLVADADIEIEATACFPARP